MWSKIYLVKELLQWINCYENLMGHLNPSRTVNYSCYLWLNKAAKLPQHSKLQRFSNSVLHRLFFQDDSTFIITVDGKTFHFQAQVSMLNISSSPLNQQQNKLECFSIISCLGVIIEAISWSVLVFKHLPTSFLLEDKAKRLPRFWAM